MKRKQLGTLTVAAICLLFARGGWGADIVVPAREHSATRGSLAVDDAEYYPLVVCHGTGGMQQWQVDVADAGKRYLHVYYASGDSRPVALTLNGRRQDGAFLGKHTGGFRKEHLAWETAGPFDFVKGKNTIQIDAAGHMPHLCGLVISPSAADWDRKAFDALLKEDADPFAKYYRQPAPFRPRPPAEGRPAEWFLKNTKKLKLDEQVYHGDREKQAKVDGMLPYRYRDAASRPSLPFDKIVFIKRFTFHSSHFYTDFLDGCSRYGGNISILDLSTGEVKDLFPADSEMAGGIFGRFTLSFDGERLVIDWKKAPIEGFRIFAVNIDGTGLRQLTFPPADEKQRIERYSRQHTGGNQSHYFHQTDDMHPCYAPDGSIFFASTRAQHGVLCGTFLTVPVLHKMDADGANIQKLTNSAVSEFSPAVLPDGWITYSRWEYVDKGQLGIKCLWAMKPDGSGSREIYGNDIPFPPTMLHGRPIPGQPSKLVMLGTPHFPQSGIGTVITVDTAKNVRTRDPMHFVTWWVDIRQEPGWNHFLGQGWMRHGNGPLYMDPHPLAEDLFLVSHNRDRGWNDPTAYELMLLDDSGNHWPLLASDEHSLWQPTPLVSQERPPVVPSTLNPRLAEKDLAVCFVQDVHHGMEGVEPGEVKYLRILEQLPRPWSCRRLWEPNQNLVYLISPRSALAGKVLRGVVPVEEDGSAHFYVPAGRNIYFEALDAKYREVQRERTYVNYMPGERRGCVGCHETPQDAPLDRVGSALALKKPPVHPQPQPGDDTAARPIHFVTDVQPVLDKHCVKCHGGERTMAGLDLRGELTVAFSRSYERLLRYVKTTDEGSDFGGSEYLPPKSVGSHASPLIKQLDKGCTGMEYELPLEDYVKITTWVDANAVYYGSYWGRIRIEHRDHPNFRPVPTLEDALATEPPVPWEKR